MQNNTHTHKIISDGYMYCEDNKMEQCNEDWRKQGMQGCFLTVETESLLEEEIFEVIQPHENLGRWYSSQMEQQGQKPWFKKKKRTGMLKEGKEYWSNLKVIWTGEVALITDSF